MSGALALRTLSRASAIEALPAIARTLALSALAGAATHTALNVLFAHKLLQGTPVTSLLVAYGQGRKVVWPATCPINIEGCGENFSEARLPQKRKTS